MRTNRSWAAVVLTASAAALSSVAGAQDASKVPDKPPAGSADKPAVLESVVVTGATSKLDKAAPTASRLGISARDTPAAIDSIDAKAIEARGYKSVAEAVDSFVAADRKLSRWLRFGSAPTGYVNDAAR